MGTIGSGGAGAVAVPAAVAVASQCLAAATVVATAGVTAMAAGAVGENISLMSKPNSGRIRYNDGTGINPETGKSVQSQKEAEEIYKRLTDPKQKLIGENG